jgi:fatty-acyl-CoA synthase
MFTPEAPALPAPSLPALLHRLVQSTRGQRPALARHRNGRWQRLELRPAERRADALARRFMVLGVRPGDRVAWLG